MKGQVFVKSYRDPHRAIAARAHHGWLASLDAGVPLPDLISATPQQLTFDHLGHRRPGPEHLDELAHTLGLLHAAAHTRHLSTARHIRPFAMSTGLVIPDFVNPRRALLEKLPIPYLGLPVALYKDANIRNFVLTENGPAIVDFDDLTLAPFGYDLAKLVVSTAMTHGHLTAIAIEQALTVYNAATAAAGDTACPRDRLRRYAEFHHLATMRYLHSNGYHHSWPDVRPWPRPRPARTTRLDPLPRAGEGGADVRPPPPTAPAGCG